MSESDEMGGSLRFRFSREIRLGDLITVLGVGLATIAAWQRMDIRVDLVEKAQAQQALTNKELRTDFHEVSQNIGADIKELRQDVGVIRDKINRARL